VVKVVPRPRLSASEQLYFVEIFKGLALTLGHALKTVFVKSPDWRGLDYPEVPAEVPRDYRARHRLMKRPDGSARCVACYMCSTACPARCINIVAEEADDEQIEKRPAQFDIDLLLCIYCGLCVEACPCDAIRMDTKIAVLAGHAREDFLIDKDQLLDWDPTDYPADDAISQEAPGGSGHAAALARFRAEEGEV
jgi:NADH-quinone oxidoreductase subunit I